MDKFVQEKVRITINKLKEFMVDTTYDIPELKYIHSGYKAPEEYPTVDDSWKTFKRDETVKGKDEHFWFYTKIKTPKISADKQIFLEVVTGRDGEWDGLNPQALVYLNEKIEQGLDINHREIVLNPDTEYDVMIYFYVGMVEISTVVNMSLHTIDLPTKKLYYDMRIPHEALVCFEKDEYNYAKILKHLEFCCNLLDLRSPRSQEFYKSVEIADKYLTEEFYQKECNQNNDVVVNYIGHTHIDVAWLWRLIQTREKVQRSFATVLKLMDLYPNYKFMSSQPQLYEYLKEEEPELYERVKEKVKEGRWEVEGAMWLEADCNLSSGESLVRQIMYGKQFIKDEFDIESKVLWLPDVFGYSAALPQILTKSGVDKFVTSKIAWSESNIMPYDTFMWEGIDGTEIFTYFLTAQTHEQHLEKNFYTTYVSFPTPTFNLGTWERYQQKDYNTETISTFGYGDGGGGPTADMLESIERLSYGLPGLPKAQYSFSKDFLDRVEKSFIKNCKSSKRTPKWVGELYLELHRGTYTSMAKNKRFNRLAEFLCQEVETISVTDNILEGEIPDNLHKYWHDILLLQFHDIIPGSSIKEVYEDSDIMYKKILDEVCEIKSYRLQRIANNISKKGIMVYNPNSFIASDYVEYDGNLIFAENIPPMGWKVIEKPDVNKVIADKKHIDSVHYRVTFDDNMNIISVFDKDNNREVAENGKILNQLFAYEDYPRDYDNWEISNFYRQKQWEVNDVKSVDIISENGYGGVKIVRSYMNSEIEQTIMLYNGNRRIDFITKADWHENHTLLRAEFPTSIHANKATYEIQFGNLERANHQNTSWDSAKFEVCAQKWGDISEKGYGVSLLNDCKYGYNSISNMIGISLIKCGTYPNTEADQGLHEFTYSLYPHKDDFAEGKTIQEAYLLNRKLTALPTDGNGSLPEKFSLISSSSENIVIETVKPAENGKGIIVRLYDAWDTKSTSTFNLGFDAKSVSLCDMMENKIETIGKGNTFQLSVNNFEIVTLLIEI